MFDTTGMSYEECLLVDKKINKSQYIIEVCNTQASIKLLN